MRKRKDETMKSMKRVLAFALAAVMSTAMSLAALAADECIRGVLMIIRWKSGKWRTKGITVKAAVPA